MQIFLHILSIFDETEKKISNKMTSAMVFPQQKSFLIMSIFLYFKTTPTQLLSHNHHSNSPAFLQ